MASLSAACWMNMLGWRDMLSRLVAWGREESAQDRLGSAMSLSWRRKAIGWMARVSCGANKQPMWVSDPGILRAIHSHGVNTIISQKEQKDGSDLALASALM